MSPLPRLLLFLGLAWLTFILFREARAVNQDPDVDASKVVLLFGSVVLVGGLAGVLFVILVMPAIGDAVGNFFFQPGGEVERNPHATAQAALARGDHAQAVEEYRQVLAADPEDVLAYGEMAKISCENLGDASGAAQTLEEALERDWPPDDAAYLTMRLVDVYWQFLRDAHRARAMLQQLMEALPDTRHAANAQHRLREIDQQLSLEG